MPNWVIPMDGATTKPKQKSDSNVYEREAWMPNWEIPRDGATTKPKPIPLNPIYQRDAATTNTNLIKNVI